MALSPYQRERIATRLQAINDISNFVLQTTRTGTTPVSRRVTLVREQNKDVDAESVEVREDGRDVFVEWQRDGNVWLWTSCVKEATVVLFMSPTAAVMRRFSHYIREPGLDEQERLAKMRRRHIDAANSFISKYSVFSEIGEQHFLVPQEGDSADPPRIIVVGLQDEYAYQPSWLGSSSSISLADLAPAQSQTHSQTASGPKMRFAEVLCELLEQSFPRIQIEKLFYNDQHVVDARRRGDDNYASLEVLGRTEGLSKNTKAHEAKVLLSVYFNRAFVARSGRPWNP